MDKKLKEAYKEKAQIQLEEFKIKIAELKTRAEKAEVNLKIKYFQELENLHKKRDEVQKKINDLKEPGKRAWEEVKRGFEKAWGDLKNSFEKAKKEIK